MRVLIAVVAYNEEENIGPALDELLALDQGYDLVVIDNGSYDGTAAICRDKGVPVVTHCINTGGFHGTVPTYFVYAHRNDYDILCQFDGDAQHVAAELPKIIGPAERGEADFVIGSRFLEKEGFQSYFIRRIGIRLFAWLSTRITGQRITDSTSGFRAYSRKTIAFFATRYRHEIHDPTQLILLSHFHGARLQEVPVVMRDREHGISEFSSPFKAAVFPLRGLVNMVGCILQRKQVGGG